MRISGKIGIKLIPAEIPFMTNISTNNQSWLQKSFGEKKINIERDNKASCQKGQGCWEQFLSQIARLVWFLFPSDHHILMEKNQFILLSQGLWPHMLNAWSQPALSPYKILPKLIKMSMLMSLLRALSFKIPLTGKGHRRVVVKAVAGTCYFMPAISCHVSYFISTAL